MDSVLGTPRTLQVRAAPDVAAAVAEVGRTEDVIFTADGRRLAVAGFGRDCVALFDLSTDGTDEVVITGCTEIRCEGFADPHGVAFIGDTSVVVANRTGSLLVVPIPPPCDGVRTITVESVCAIQRAGDEIVHSPGSVATVELAPGIHEILVCNNYAHRVTRHVFDSREGDLLWDEVLLASGLDTPDGIAVSGDGRWIAVSSHSTHEVVVYERAFDAGPQTEPAAHLHGIAYPHGLRFSRDGVHLVVADAGAPYVYTFARAGTEWSGTMTPMATMRVMDDETFALGHTNPQEGGPKGLAIDPHGTVVVISSEHQPLAFFRVHDVLGRAPGPPEVAGDGDAARDSLLDELARTRRYRARVEALEQRQRGLDFTWQTVVGLREHLAFRDGELADKARELDDMRASRSWRMTAPLRQLAEFVRVRVRPR